jgi:GntR family transcriptional regulator
VTQQDPRPRHQQIAADLRAQIMAGDLPPGSQLPSTQHLVAEYSAANATIQKALSALKREGFLTSRAGKGVYVRDRHSLVIGAGAYIPPTAGYQYQVLDVRETVPPPEVASALQLPSDGRTVLRQRLLVWDGSPVELSWSYYPAEIAVGTRLAKRTKILGGAPAALLEAGLPQRSYVDRLSARLPTVEELQTLDLPGDVPVLRQFRLIYSDDQRPVEASILIKGAHLHELRYEQIIDEG